MLFICWLGRITIRVRSTYGYWIVIGGNKISWRARKKKTVVLSSVEDEYRYMEITSKDLAWLKNLLLELRLGDLQEIIYDNQVAFHIALNLVFHERTKHIKIYYHYVKDNVLSGKITTNFVNFKKQYIGYYVH